ncbi:hypothetical protein ACOJIV_18245 [Haloarcula sp. AONF1]
MSGTTHDPGPTRDDGPPTPDDQPDGDVGPKTVRVVDRRSDDSNGTRRKVPVRTETKEEERGPIVELDPWPLISIGMLLGAIIVVLLLHLLGVV